MHLLLDFHDRPRRTLYAETIFRALAAGLRATGRVEAEDLSGPRALPWSCAAMGVEADGPARRISSLLLATPCPRLAEAFERLDPAMIVATTAEDRLDLSGATLRRLRPQAALDGDRMRLRCLSPVLLPRRKEAASAGRFVEDPGETNIAEALLVILSRRAGRPIDLAIDLLSVERARTPLLRRGRDGRALRLPALALDLVAQGAPADLRFAALAGLGVKTHLGLGAQSPEPPPEPEPRPDP